MIIGDVLSFGGSGVLPKINVSGLLSTDSVVATMGSKTKSGKWKLKPNPASHNLPSGYTQLEYIQSDGNQHINIGYYPTNTTKIVVDFQYTTASPISRFIIGRYQASSNSKCSIYVDDYSRWAFSFGDYYTSTLPTSDNARHTFTLNASTKKVYVDSTEYALNYSTYTATQSHSLIMFDRIRTDGTFDGGVTGKFYSLYIENNNVATRNCVPCKRNSDNAIGMWDTVTETFFGNDGTGSFTGGNEVPQYIGYYQIDIDSFGLWNVTATSGVKTKTISVNVDTVREYDVEWDWIVYLYDTGDECESLTGGWGISGYSVLEDSTVFSLSSGTKNSNNLYCASPGTGTSAVGLGMLSPIDITNFNTLHIDYTKTNLARIYYSSSKAIQTADDDCFTPTDASSRTETSFDISNLSGNMYFFLLTVNQSGRNIITYKLWLE